MNKKYSEPIYCPLRFINLIKIIGLETTQNWCTVLKQIEQACILESICRRLIPKAGMFCPLVMGTGAFGYELSRATRITELIVRGT